MMWWCVGGRGGETWPPPLRAWRGRRAPGQARWSGTAGSAMLRSFDASRNGSPIATVILDRSLGETPRRFSKALVLAAFVLENDARLPGSPADVLPEDADIESCFQQHGIVIGELLGRQCLTDILV